MNHITLKIEGMSCGHCVASVKKALDSVEGVTVEQVAIGTATVDYDPAIASAEKIAEAVKEAGYMVTQAA
jgi:copper chaperone